MNPNDISVFLLLGLSLVLFPVIAYNHRKSSLVFFMAVFLGAIVFHLKTNIEKYERMDFFPWNEAKLVKKRHRDSTVIDCAWYMDQDKSDNIFHQSDPVVSKYDNLS